MKRNVLFSLFALCCMLVGFSASAATADTTQVGSINGWSQSVVMSLSNSQFEMVYPSELLKGLNGACKISELAFPYVQTETGAAHTGGHTGDVKVYLANTTDAEVGTAFSDVSKMTLVYDGQTTWEGGSEANPNWNSYELSTPFTYTGRNLRLVIVKKAPIYSSVRFGAQVGLNIPCLFQDGYSDDVVNDLKRGKNVIPVTRIAYAPLDSGATLTSSVYNWNVGKATIGQTYTQDITLKGARLNGDVSISASASGLVKSSVATVSKADAEAGATVTLSLTPADDQATADQITIASEGIEPIQLNVAWQPVWARPGSATQVGDPNSAASDFRVPAKLNSKYSKSELLYTASELNLGGSSTITKIAFPYAKDKWSSLKPEFNANVKLYLQNTTDEAVGDAITATSQLTKVYDGTVKYTGAGTPDAPQWLEFEFSQPFNYTGGSLRVVYENENEVEKACSYYFRDDYGKHKAALLSYGTSATKLDAADIKGQAFPVMKVYSEASISADPAKFEAGDVALYSTAWQTVTLTVVGELNNGIAISAPTTQYVKVTPASFTNEQIAAAGGKVSFTIIVTPEETATTRDKIVVSSRGLDDITVPVTWNPVLGYKATVRTVGETNDVSQKMPLFSTWEASESEIVYQASDIHLKKGAKIRRIELPMTFNANAVDEQLTVSLANTTEAEVGTEFTEGMTQVAKVTKRIPAGGQVEAATPFYWLTFDLPEAFVYDGSNLRFRIKGVSDKVSEEWYFSSDSKRKGELPILIRFAESDAALAGCTFDNKQLYRSKAAFPVIRITAVDESTDSESKFDLDSYSWVAGSVEQGKEYTHVVKVSASGLKGDITISTPASSAVTVSPATIAKADAEAGTATFTVTLKPAEVAKGSTEFTVASEGADAITYPVYWNTVAADTLTAVQAGTINQWYPYMPFDLASTSSHSEFIYRAADLGLDGSNKYIRRISYPYYQASLHGDADPMTTKVAIYVQNTTDTDVPNDDEGFTSLDKLTKVFEGEVTFKEGTAKAPVYATFNFDKEFLYTGNNLRVVCVHEGENFAGFNQIYFAQDADKAAQQYSLYTYDQDIRYKTGVYYPVAKFYVENAPTVRLSATACDFGQVEIGKTYTRKLTLSASNLLGDIVVSDPASSELTVTPSVIAKADAEAGAVELTVTLKPSAETTGSDAVELFTDGGETVTLPITWVCGSGVNSVEFDQPTSVEVYDMLGRRVAAATVTGSLRSELGSLPLNRGTYVVKAGNSVYKLQLGK